MTVDDLAALLGALLVVFLPGAALLAALRVRGPLLLLAVGPPASIAVASVVGNGVAVVSVRYGIVPLVAVTVVLAAVGVARAVRDRRRRAGERNPTPPLRFSAIPLVVGALLVLVSSVAAMRTWARGIGPLSTVPQEHDMVVHVLLADYIARTGRAATWQVLPTDVLTGADPFFYPAGLHRLVAVSVQLTGDTVVAINAITVVVLALVLAAGTAALAFVAARQLRLGRGSAVLAAGLSVLVIESLYRPSFQLMHDGGILPNAATLAFTPGVVAGVLALRPTARWREPAAVGAGCAGTVIVHPSAVASIGVTLVAWWAGQAMFRRGRQQLRSQVLPVLTVVGVAGVLATLTLIESFAVATRTAGFPAGSSPGSFPVAVGNALGFAYGGYLDPDFHIGQAAAAVLVVVGAAAVLATRRGWGVVAAWAAWCAVTISYFVAPGSGPGGLISGFFYHSQSRVWSHVSLIGAVLAGIGVVLVANAAALWSRRHLPVPAAAAAAALVLFVGIGYLLGPAADYAATNAEAVASRYRAPDFSRVDADDQRAIDWLATRIRPGQRVLNSANDGSTYLYVEHGIPIVNVGTLGLQHAPYTYEFLRAFREFPVDPGIRQVLTELNIAWVYVDTEAPTIGSGGAPNGWAGPDGFTLAPGLSDLDGLPGLRVAYRSGSVTVYSVELAVVQRL